MIMLTPFTPISVVFPNLYNFRQYSMLLFVFMILGYCLYRKRLVNVGIRQIVLYIIAIIIWSMIGIYNGYNAFQEASPLVVMLLSFIAVVVAYKEGFIEKKIIKIIAFFLMIAWCCVYFALAVGLLFGLISIQFLMPILDVYMQANNTITMGNGFLGMLPRIGAGVNIVPFIIYAFYIYENKKYDILIWILLLFYTIIDCGRIDMMLFCVLTCFKVYYNFKHNLRIKNICKRLSILIMLMIPLFWGMSISDIGVSDFYDGWTERYDRPSDSRTLQIQYLNDYIEEKTIIGYGLGAFTPEYTRAGNRWIYEMQFHAFVMQMGILGFLIIVVNYLIIFITTVYKGCERKYLPIIFICIAFWIIDCIFQGGLYHNDGRVICILIYVLSRKDGSTCRGNG